MSWVNISLGIFLFLGSFLRIGLNAYIYNQLHGTHKRLFVTKGEPGGGEDESAESFLFMAYCLFILVWIRYRKPLFFHQLISNALGILSLLALILALPFEFGTLPFHLQL